MKDQVVKDKFIEMRAQGFSYKAMSVELTRRAIELHYSPDGYFTYSGNVAKNVIDPKYNALLLKGFVNLLTIDEPLYPQYYSLFKDR